jgi:hypothetical protein
MAMTEKMRSLAARGGILAGVFALGIVLCAAPAAAQSSDQGGEAQSYRLPGWSFTPSIGLGAIYDNNVALSAPTAELGETQGDSLFNIVPSGQLEFIGKRTDFSLNYRGFLRRYFEAEGLDGFDQRGSMTFKRAMSRRLTLFARDSFADSPTTDDVELNGVLFRRTGSRTNTFAAGTEYRVSKFINWSARYDNTWVSFDRPDIYLTGGWIHALRNEVSYQLSERASVGGEYGYRQASLNEGAREFGFQDAGAVVHVILGRGTKANAAAGFATLRDRNLNETRSGPYVRLGIAHSLSLATVGAAFERQYVPSFGFGGASNSQELRGYVLMPLPLRGVYTQLSGAWRRTMPFENQTLELDTVWLRSTVGYTVARWMRVEGLYTFTRQDSIVTGGEVDRHRVGVQLVISQPMRIQ